MKILFSALHFGFFRNFESVVRDLASRGHEILLTADEPEDLGGRGLVERLAATHAGVRVTWTPSYDGEAWFRVARRLRQGIDYLRFLEPRYEPFPKLRERAADRAPLALTEALRMPGTHGATLRRLLTRSLAALDRAMPRNAAMDRFLETERPDVALFASVTNPRAPQLDHLRSARALGIPTGVCVYSWDHLSSKALIRVLPDRVYVWNETQKREAVDLHGLPADRIVVTGAQVYDQWFGRQPSQSRDSFAAEVGLPAGRPLFLYVCSALTPDPGEARFVRAWVASIRRDADARVRNAAILIRPHPERRKEWAETDWSALGPIAITGQNPVSAEAKASYYDALHYSSAVVGLVTSAFLEAAIAGRPVLTVMLPEFRIHQEGMLHFRYLLEVEGGLLSVARTMDEHVEQLKAVIGGDRSWEARQQRFLQAFVRPRGLDVPATPVFADEVEALARAGTVAVPDAVPAWQRALARRVVASADRGLLQPLLRDVREQAERRARDQAVFRHRRELRDKWRQHRRRKFMMRVQWKLKRVRDLVWSVTSSRHD